MMRPHTALWLYSMRHFPLCQLHCPLCCFSSMPNEPLPQGLCTCCLLSLEYISPEIYRLALLLHPDPCLSITSLKSSSLTFASIKPLAVPPLLTLLFFRSLISIWYLTICRYLICWFPSPSKRENSIRTESLSTLSLQYTLNAYNGTWLAALTKYLLNKFN